MKHLLIIGARGWGREVLWTAKGTIDYQSGLFDIKGFLDEKTDALDGLQGVFPPILGPVETYEIQADDIFFCALGDSFARKKYVSMIEEKGGSFISLISPLAVVSPNAIIGDGTIVGSFSTISDNVKIGEHVVIQSYNDIGHDVAVGDFATIESYVFLGGYVKVGEFCTMHTKSTVLPHKSVGNMASVGVGSVVMRNVKDGLHVFGNPAIRIE